MIHKNTNHTKRLRLITIVSLIIFFVLILISYVLLSIAIDKSSILHKNRFLAPQPTITPLPREVIIEKWRPL